MPVRRVLFFAVAVLGGVQSPICRATALPGADALIRAADVVVADPGSVGREPPMPVSDPRVRTLLAAASDKAVFGDAVLTREDASRLHDICSAPVKASMLYTLAGMSELKPLTTGDPVVLQRRAAEIMQRNWVAYQDVLLPLSSFGLRCMARSVRVLSDVVAVLPAGERTPVRTDGLRQFRRGGATAMIAAVQASVAQEFSRQNQRMALEAASASAVAIASAMSLKDRMQVSAAIASVIDKGRPEDRPLYETLRSAFADGQCTGLCAYAD